MTNYKLLVLSVCGFAFGCSSDDNNQNNASNNQTIASNNQTSGSNNGTSSSNNGTSASNNGTSGSNNGTSTNNQPSTTACNGHDELCDRRFDEVVLAGAHNAMSNEADEWIAANQQVGIEQQLADGIRGFMLDSYETNDFFFCHQSCNFGRIRILDAFAIYKQFLDDNPREVIAFILQDGISVADQVRLFDESGLSEFVYTPESQTWPTLREMIESNQRLVVTAEETGPPPAWYLYAWDTYFETPFSFREQSDFNCDPNRGADTNSLFLINHWLSIPIPTLEGAMEVNQYDVLYNRAIQCQTERGHITNMLAVDHYSVGDLFEVVDVLNGVRDPR